MQVRTNAPRPHPALRAPDRGGAPPLTTHPRSRWTQRRNRPRNPTNPSRSKPSAAQPATTPSRTHGTNPLRRPRRQPDLPPHREPAMPEPGVHIETIHNPGRYSHAQIEFAAAIASELARGKLVLTEAPANPAATDDP